MGQYLLSLLAAAIISAVVVSLFDKNSFMGKHIRLLAGIFLSITIISPVYKLNVPDFEIFKNNIEMDAQQYVRSGEAFYRQKWHTVISEQIESYILNKALSLNADIRVNILLDESEPPIPEFVEIEGAVSPYVKSTLELYMKNELGIPKERQKWN